MTDENATPGSKPEAEAPEEAKKPYQKPGFRFERVFETMALSCGKISITQKHCKFNRQAS